LDGWQIECKKALAQLVHNINMTLTELKYIVAVAREKHFGRAADACFISQPTLSVSIKKLEDELEVKLFERNANEVTVTPLGEEIVRQAQSVLEQAANIREIAKRGKDPLAGALKLGVIYTIGPYLLPALVRQAIARTPQMPLMLQENFTVKLLEQLRTGEIDCAILAEPFPDAGLATADLYDEPFMVAVPSSHPLAARASVSAEELKQETMLLLGNGHCFRDHVLEVCPEFARFSSSTEGIRKSFEGSSLETIRHMVAAGMGVTVVPLLSIPRAELAASMLAAQAVASTKTAKAAVSTKAAKATEPVTMPAKKRSAAATSTALLQAEPAYVRYLPFQGDAPTRRVVLAWRRSFTRYEAIAALRNAVYACELAGVKRLSA
jgi:LysR family transcriptional regulator, hydrogen peroxide-inducible genes activator